MRFGVLLPHAGHAADPDALVAVSQAAESGGFDSVWVGDHVFMPRVTSEYPYSEDGRYLVNPDRPFLEAFTSLAYVAGATKQIKLGVSVCVVPHRPIPLLAKTAASLDVLSGGRFILGVGAGWSRDEIEGLGMPFDRRGAFTDEALAFSRAAWEAPDGCVSYHGEFVDVEDMYVMPRPVRDGRLPIWVGGAGAAAKRRAAQYGAAWYPPLSGSNPEVLAAGIAEVRERAASEGRSAVEEPIELTTVGAIRFSDEDRPAASGTLEGSPSELAEQIDELAAAGVSQIVFLLGGSGRRRIALMERFAGEVAPLMHEAKAT